MAKPKIKNEEKTTIDYGTGKLHLEETQHPLIFIDKTLGVVCYVEHNILNGMKFLHPLNKGMLKPNRH